MSTVISLERTTNNEESCSAWRWRSPVDNVVLLLFSFFCFYFYRPFAAPLLSFPLICTLRKIGFRHTLFRWYLHFECYSFTEEMQNKCPNYCESVYTNRCWKFSIQPSFQNLTKSTIFSVVRGKASWTR